MKGLYPLGDDDTCWWVAADFDKEPAMLDALAYMKAARAYQVPAALEVSQSGRGAHVWIFFAFSTSAATARTIATNLLGEAFQLRGSMHPSSYDRPGRWPGDRGHRHLGPAKCWPDQCSTVGNSMPGSARCR